MYIPLLVIHNILCYTLILSRGRSRPSNESGLRDRNGKGKGRGQMSHYIHKVQYYETDQMQIAHHSNYIRWFEEARTFFLETAGFGYDKMEAVGILCPVTEVQCRYVNMVRFPDEVLIHTKIQEFSGVRMTVGYSILNARTGDLCAEGFSRHCFLGKSGKPVALQKENPSLFRLLSEKTEKPC